MTRPSSKLIYKQRKEYSQAMAVKQSNFQHRVEHLLTCKLDSRVIQDTEDVMRQLQLMEAQGRVWGQDVVLQSKDHQLQLLDIETREELDCYPLDGVQELDAVLNSCSYDSILSITIRESSQTPSSVLLFQCREVGAELLKFNLQKLIDERRGSRQYRSNLEAIVAHQGRAGPPPWQGDRGWRGDGGWREDGGGRGPGGSPSSGHQDGWAGPPSPRNIPAQAPSTWSPSSPQQPLWAPPQEPPPRGRIERGLPAPQYPSTQEWRGYDPQPQKPQPPQDMEQEKDILNHLLTDIELFSERVRKAREKMDKKRKLRKKNQGVSLPLPQFEDYFQKIKCSFNLLGMLSPSLQQPSSTDLVHILFQTLIYVLANCPEHNLAVSVVIPLLTPTAIALLQECLSSEEATVWESLGQAWRTPREFWPEGAFLPSYVPRFYDGWQPPESSLGDDFSGPAQVPGRTQGFGSQPPRPQDSSSSSPLRMRVLYEFQSRNPPELTVSQGEMLEILDQSKQWWLVRNRQGQTGYIPNNILEATQPRGQGPMLRPSSRPEEVTAWLQAEKFSTITVKALGALNGRQLLQMGPRELQMVCPEEAPHILARLQQVQKEAHGMGP
ncbi:epidermal growth factor receptor kinase substrate 8-like protein 3 [Tachyglossus aculeatus]|uniref:epidermal growth factor receptor kinase substrate 8-like protein 3 n=1 Tax=Tachyglossus aculeatus TaxID=9261 RepID=UPI0018F53EF4|nr:epidermal growth factor receptor kinase substrate 8-like protein 3 [Tachyglossus aculeatus]